MPEREQCVELLQKWIEDNCLIPKSIEGFWQAFAKSKIDNIQKHKSLYGEDDTAVSLRNVSANLVLEDHRTGDNSPPVRLVVVHDICINNDIAGIGYYKAIFTLDGEWDDDVLFYS